MLAIFDVEAIHSLIFYSFCRTRTIKSINEKIKTGVLKIYKNIFFSKDIHKYHITNQFT